MARDAGHWARKGDAFLRDGRLAEAEEAFRRACALAPFPGLSLPS